MCVPLASLFWSVSVCLFAHNLLFPPRCVFARVCACFGTCILFQEPITRLKLLGVLLTCVPCLLFVVPSLLSVVYVSPRSCRVGGACCVAFSDKNSGTDRVYGDLICLFSAIMCAPLCLSSRVSSPCRRLDSCLCSCVPRAGTACTPPPFVSTSLTSTR